MVHLDLLKYCKCTPTNAIFIYEFKKVMSKFSIEKSIFLPKSMV